MDQPFLGGIYLVSFNFAPRGFVTCDGQVLSISQNTALFSLVGTYYGGNGVNTFALPDLRGRVAIHQGQGPGLSPYSVGQVFGAEGATLSTNQLPAHNHTLNVNNTGGTVGVPLGTSYIAAGPSTGSGPNATQLKTYNPSAPNVALGAQSIGMTGGGQPVPILQPGLTVTYILAVEGIFPSRN